MTTKMTITRALATIKTLGVKISRDTDKLKVFAFTDGQDSLKRVVGYPESVTADQVEAAIKADYQSLRDMIAQRAKLKSAVVLSNAKTLVTIAGVEMTVAEAIERKTSIDFDVQLMIRLRKNQISMTTEANARATLFERKLSEVEANVSSKDKKVTEDERTIVTRPIYLRSEPKTLDVIGVEAEFRKLEKEIEDFASEVDFILSESNALTQIEV